MFLAKWTESRLILSSRVAHLRILAIRVIASLPSAIPEKFKC